MGHEGQELRRIGFEEPVVAYEVAGKGPPLLLIHGLSGSGRWWSRNVPVLAKRYRVYAVDLVGFGGSRGRGRFDLERAAAHLVTLLDRLGIERASIIGHSMGGLIALDLAAAFPERVDRLVLVGPALFPTRRERSPGRRAWGFVRSMRTMPPDVLPLLARDALRAGPRTLGLAASQLLRADWTAKLGRVRAPVLVICGANDRLVPVACGRALAEQLAHARLVILPGCGHTPMWDRSEEFNDLVIRFLSTGEVECDPAA